MASILKVKDNNGNVIDIPAIKGESAYEIALKNGFEGTEKEWIESLGSKTNLQLMEAEVDNTAVIHNIFNAYTLTFEADLPTNARVKRIEIPDVVNGTNEYISLDDMVFKDTDNGFGASYYIIYPKNQEGVYCSSVAAVVVFIYQTTNQYCDYAFAGLFGGLTIKIYYEIEE